MMQSICFAKKCIISLWYERTHSSPSLPKMLLRENKSNNIMLGFEAVGGRNRNPCR